MNTPYTLCALFWVAKLDTVHILQDNQNKHYRVADFAYQCPLTCYYQHLKNFYLFPMQFD